MWHRENADSFPACLFQILIPLTTNDLTKYQSSHSFPKPFHRALVSVRALQIEEELLCCALNVLVEFIFGRDLVWHGAMSLRDPPNVVGRHSRVVSHAWLSAQPQTKLSHLKLSA